MQKFFLDEDGKSFMKCMESVIAREKELGVDIFGHFRSSSDDLVAKCHGLTHLWALSTYNTPNETVRTLANKNNSQMKLP